MSSSSRFWTLYISLSNSTLLPTYEFVGFKHYFELWSNQRWTIAYGNLFFFSALLRRAGARRSASRSPSRSTSACAAKSIWRTIFLYPLAVSFVVTGTVWSWLYSPNAGIEFFVRGLGWTDFTFRLTTDRDTAIYAIIATGVWQSSGFAMALFLAGLRSVDPDIVKAAQIDGASRFRIYRKVILPSIAPIFIAVVVVLLQFAIKTFDLVVALTNGGPGISTTFPANYVYDLMFQRGADRDRRRGGDHDAGGARRRARALCAVERLAKPAGGARPWLTRPSTPTSTPRSARGEPALCRSAASASTRSSAFFALIYLLPLFVDRRQFVPRPAGDHAERPDRACRAASRSRRGRRPGRISASPAPARASSAISTIR